MAGRDKAFDRRLEQVVVSRLQAGHDPESLLRDLRTRLDPAQATALMSRAEARVADPAPNVDRTVQVLAGLAYGWTVLLIFQNIGVLSAIAGVPMDASDGGRLLASHMAFALLKIGLLCAAVFAFKRWRSLATTMMYVAAILFAFPLGLYIQEWGLGTPGGRIERLLTLSAIGSYAAAVFVVVVFRRTRDGAPKPTAFDALD